MSTKRKLVIVLTHHGGHETSTVGFTIANMALASGREVGIFLMADGVELAREGGAGMAHVRPFHPLHELIEEFEAHGAWCGRARRASSTAATTPRKPSTTSR